MIDLFERGLRLPLQNTLDIVQFLSDMGDILHDAIVHFASNAAALLLDELLLRGELLIIMQQDQRDNITGRVQEQALIQQKLWLPRQHHADRAQELVMVAHNMPGQNVPFVLWQGNQAIGWLRGSLLEMSALAIQFSGGVLDKRINLTCG